MSRETSSSISGELINGARVLSLELPEDRYCIHPIQVGGCFCAIRTGGNVLKGTCAIELGTSHHQLIDVCFEGICRTWLRETNTGQCHLYEHRFLQQVQCIEVRSGPENASTTGPTTHIKPFEFCIPAKIPADILSSAPHPDYPTRELYPSIRLGRVYTEALTGKVFAQPLVMYQLSASIRTNNTRNRPRLGVARQIQVIPTALCPPPMNIEAFVGEYVQHIKSKTRNRFSARSIGSLELRAEEPQALRLPEKFSRAETTVFLKVSFQQADTASGFQAAPYKWKFRIRSRLQRRVFWTTKPSGRIPTVADSRPPSLIGLRTNIVHTATSEYEDITWRNNHTSASGTIVPTAEATDRWIATIPVSIPADHSLIPSFSCPTAWLRYSVLLDVRILGAWSSHASLAIPVQVRRPPLHMPKSDLGYRDTPSSVLTQSDIVEDVDAGSRQKPPEYRRIPF